MATNNYCAKKVITQDWYYKLYKGFHQIVMKYNDYPSNTINESCFNNIVFASRISHKNVLKFIGCCLETNIPTLVFEYVEYVTLADRIHGPHRPHFEPFLFSNRLKIAMEIANAVAYLHFGFSRPIVFRDIKPSLVILDEKYVAKLYNFSACRAIPEGQTHIKDGPRVGTMGFMAPECFTISVCNEKYDVYSFGILLLELLTGKRIHELVYDCSIQEYVKNHIDNNRYNEIIDPTIVQDESQLQAFIQLSMYQQISRR